MTSIKNTHKPRCGKTYRFCPTCGEKHPFRGCYSKCNVITNKHQTAKQITRSLPNNLKNLDLDLGITPSKIHKLIKSIKNNEYRERKNKMPLLKDSDSLDQALPFKSLKQKQKQPIKCCVCMETKGNYKTLGCNHKICTGCWETILISDTLQDNCPLCRQDMFSENWASYLFVKKNPNARHFKLFKVDDSMIDYFDNEGVFTD